MAPFTTKKRKHDSITKTKPHRPIKKFKKQTHYSSSSSSSASADEASAFPAVDLADSASESDAEEDDQHITHKMDIENGNASSTKPKQKPSTTQPRPPSFPSPSSASDSNSDSESSPFSSLSDSPSTSKPRQKPQDGKTPTSKRNDPTAFASSISSILSSKLPRTNRTDPVLARSSSAHAANTALRDASLEKRARQALRAEKKALLEKGRVKDVLLGTVAGEAEGGAEEVEEGKAGRIAEEERRLKKTAQRGVVKLFNAVRMAQVRGEEARKEALGKGIVGSKRREERVGEM
ncbi:MAG: hypothetical protein LQ338_007895, partial [Usnochroma carphineum]